MVVDAISGFKTLGNFSRFILRTVIDGLNTSGLSQKLLSFLHNLNDLDEITKHVLKAQVQEIDEYFA